MAKCIIICPLYKGECLEALTPGPGDLLLCADGGYRPALRSGLTPDLVIGDFDTLPPPENGKVPLRFLSVHKDDTDLGVCIQEGRDRGYREFVLAGCLGGRVDHTLACLQLMADGALRGESFRAVDALNDLTILTPGTYTLPRREGRLLSLLAFSEQVEGITLQGTEWPLTDATLTQRYPLGISNVITGRQAALSFRTGLLLLDEVINQSPLAEGAKI